MLGFNALGRFALGEVAEPVVTLSPASGDFAVTGRAIAFETFMVGTQWIVSSGALGASATGEGALGQAESFRGTFPLRLTYGLTGSLIIDRDTEVARCGLFSVTGGPYTQLSYDLLGGGGPIAAGTFSRGRWRSIQEQLAAEREAARAAIAAEMRHWRAQAQAAARAERDRRAATRAETAAAHAAAASQRVLLDALAAVAHVGRTHDLARQTVALHALAAAAHADAHAKAQDEDEALALLLAA